MNSDDKPLVITDEENQYSLVLPIPLKHFNEFVSGLLGKPQTIEKVFKGNFEIDYNTIETIHELLNQRLTQQNKAILVQFTAKIIFDDDSSVLINSIDDFLAYKEIHPIVSTILHVSWVYLIQFHDKVVPEKQQIELTFYSKRALMAVDEDFIIFRPEKFLFINHHNGIARLRINHTARTWGVDIQALLTSHLSNIVKPDTKLLRFISNNYFSSNLFINLLLFIGTVVIAVAIWKPRILKNDISPILNLEPSISNVIIKLNYLIESNMPPDNGLTPRLMLIVVFSLAIAVLLGQALFFIIKDRPASFILLTAKAIEKRDTYLKKRKRRKIIAIASIIGSVILGVLTNWIYDRYFRQ